MMHKVHYLPYGEDESEFAACGTFIPDEGYITEWWSRVTCKRCLKNKEKIEESYKIDEQLILASMEEFDRLAFGDKP